MIWDDANVAIVRRRWEAGDSASEIGAALGCSRNAIIGKVHRLKLAKRKDTLSLRIPSDRPLAKGVRKRHRSPLAPKRQKVAVEEIDHKVVHILDSAIPFDQRKDLFTLQPHDCHYPVGEPGHVDFFYCGAPNSDTNGRPYCQGHYDRMFRPPPKRVYQPQTERPQRVATM